MRTLTKGSFPSRQCIQVHLRQRPGGKIGMRDRIHPCAFSRRIVPSSNYCRKTSHLQVGRSIVACVISIFPVNNDRNWETYSS
jgi:hypothetical protein